MSVHKRFNQHVTLCRSRHSNQRRPDVEPQRGQVVPEASGHFVRGPEMPGSVSVRRLVPGRRHGRRLRQGQAKRVRPLHGQDHRLGKGVLYRLLMRWLLTPWL